MLRIKIIKEHNNIKKITFKGHANYSEYGTDIVCASASATMLCTVNAILSINSRSIEVIQTNDKQIINVLSNDEITIKLLNNMLKCLESLEEQYPKNIEIK
jgi:hypothetical protein